MSVVKTSPAAPSSHTAVPIDPNIHSGCRSSAAHCPTAVPASRPTTTTATMRVFLMTSIP